MSHGIYRDSIAYFRIKIPFELIEHCLETAEHEFDYCNHIERLIAEYIFTEYKNNNSEFAEFLRPKYDDIDTIIDYSEK